MLGRLRAAFTQSFALRLVLSLAIIVVAVTTAAGVTYDHADRQLRDATETDLVTSAHIEADRLDRWLHRMRVQTLALSEAAAFRSGDRADVSVRLWEAVERDPDVEAAYLVNTTTNTVTASTGSASTVSAEGVLKRSGQNSFVELLADDPTATVVSRPFRPYEGSAPVLIIGTGVPERENRGVLTVVNLEQLSSSEPHRVNPAKFVVVDESGRAVMAENRSRILDADYVSPGRYGDDDGFLIAGGPRGAVAVGHAQMDAKNWTVTARMPTDEAFALRDALTLRLAALVVVVLVVVGGIGATFGRNTVATVGRLAEHARRLRSGGLGESVSTDRSDEFGDLYRAFEGMRVALKREIDEAEAARAEAERLRRDLERDAERFGEVMLACAGGNLDRRLDAAAYDGAMARIAHSFNAMMDDLRDHHDRMATFTGVLSHDLRNPLTVAHGRASMLARDADSSHVEPLVESLDRIETIVDDALLLARGADTTTTSAVSLDAAAEAAWRQVGTGDATLGVDDDVVLADPDLLGHVLENLFRNSVEHSHGDTAVRVGPTEDGFFVGDDGPGIPEADREDVFDTDYTTGGTGLGLAIVAQVAEELGWRVSATESASGGARFEFSGVERPE